MAAPSTGDDNREITDINVTPLVDVTLVLLVIFMVTASLMITRVLPVKLPESATGAPAGQVTWQVVLLRGPGYLLNGKRMTGDELAAKVRAEVRLRSSLRVDLAADGGLSYREIVAALDLLKQQGVRHVALSVVPR
ncbi:MAG: biopolymer transporter ExbD [Candidatus Coatesbacteria bacterium]